MENKELLIKKESEFLKNDSLELKKKRQKFLDWLLGWNINPSVEVLEMYSNGKETIKIKKQIPQYLKEYYYCNTRKKIPTETRAEIDKLELEKAIEVICKICLELIKSKIHFCVFYAKGQRSPHIIIYDFEDLKELKPYQRDKAQLEFWRSLIPFHVHNLDRSIWQDDHYVPLEFAPHWKYGTPFNLLFEYNPFPKKSNEEQYQEQIKNRRDYAKKRMEEIRCKKLVVI